MACEKHQHPGRALTASSRELPHGLREAVERAGYYPDLVCDIVQHALCGESIVDFFVHQETTLNVEQLMRHITVLVLTDSRLIVGHVDDHASSAPGASQATATTESIPLRSVNGVMLTHEVARPSEYRPGTLGKNVTVSITWGAVSRLTLNSAMCEDQSCTADHGYDGTLQRDDIALRVSAEVDGADAVEAVLGFARSLSSASGSAAG